MSKWIEAEVAEKKQWNDRLYSIRLKADFPDFEAGQFTKLALEIEGEEVGRPFSLVNAPDEALLDFYFIEVLDGVLSPRLAALKPGDKVMVGNSASGRLTLNHIGEGKHLFLLSTGTGIGPFLSILKTSEPWKRFEQVTLVHAVRHHDELTYEETIADIQQQHTSQFSYIPFVSREKSEFALAGRIPQAISDGRLEERVGVKFNSQDSQVMLCGNPAMVQETMAVLIDERGLSKHSQREPGNISIEKYW